MLFYSDINSSRQWFECSVCNLPYFGKWQQKITGFQQALWDYADSSEPWNYQNKSSFFLDLLAPAATVRLTQLFSSILQKPSYWGKLGQKSTNVVCIGYNKSILQHLVHGTTIILWHSSVSSKPVQIFFLCPKMTEYGVQLNFEYHIYATP